MNENGAVSGGMKLLTGRFGVSLVSLAFYSAAAHVAAEKSVLAPLAAMAIVGEVVRVVSGMGLVGTLMRMMPRHLARGDGASAGALLRGIALYTLLASCLLGAVLWAGRHRLSLWLMGRPAVPLEIGLIIAFAVLMRLYDVLQSALTACQRFGLQSLAYVITMASQRALALVLLFRLGVQGCLVGFAAGAGIGVVACLVWLRGELFGGVRVAGFRGLFAYSLPYYAQSFARYAFYEGDQLVVGLVLPPELLVSYFMAKRIAHGMRMLVDSATDVLRPKVGELEVRGAEAVRAAFHKASRFLAYLVVPVTMGVAAVSRPLMVLFAGEGYADAGPILCVLSLAMLIYAWFSLYDVNVHMLGRPAHRLAVDMACAVVAVGAMVGLVGVFAGLGAALARLAGFGAGLAVGWMLLRRIRTLRPDVAAVRKACLAGGVMFTVVGAGATLYPAPWAFPSLLVAGVAIYLFLWGRRLRPWEVNEMCRAVPAPLSGWVRMLERLLPARPDGGGEDG